MKGEGLRYERKAIAELKKHFKEPVQHGPWIEYYDAEGRGFAQPDALIVGKDWVIVVEAKRTFVEEALEKLQNFYRPLVAALYPGKAILCVQVCKNLTPAAKAHEPWAAPWELPEWKIPLASYHLPLLYG